MIKINGKYKLNRKGFTLFESIMTMGILIVAMHMIAVFFPRMAKASRDEELRLLVLTKNLETIEQLKVDYYRNGYKVDEVVDLLESYSSYCGKDFSDEMITKKYREYYEKKYKDELSDDEINVLVDASINKFTQNECAGGLDYITTVIAEPISVGYTEDTYGVSRRKVYNGGFNTGRYYSQVVEENDDELIVMIYDLTGAYPGVLDIDYEIGGLNDYVTLGNGAEIEYIAGLPVGYRVEFPLDGNTGDSVHDNIGKPLYVDAIIDGENAQFSYISEAMYDEKSQGQPRFTYKVTVSTEVNWSKPLHTDMTLFLTPYEVESDA